MVEPERRLQDLPKAEFATQRQKIFESGPSPLDGEAVTGISVWLAPDAPQSAESVTSSDRLQVLDGVITYVVMGTDTRFDCRVDGMECDLR
jgi:hypothetical protein